jgi:hypothetical protein
VSRRVGDLTGDSIRTDDGVLVDLLINDDGNCNDLLGQNNNLGDELAQTALLKIFGRHDGSSICESQARSESKRGRETHHSGFWLRQDDEDEYDERRFTVGALDLYMPRSTEKNHPSRLVIDQYFLCMLQAYVARSLNLLANVICRDAGSC